MSEDIGKNNFKTKFNNAMKKLLDSLMNAKTFWTALAILLILFIISIVVLSIRLYDYTKTDDREVSLRSSMDETLEVFSVEYKNASGEVTVSGLDGDKVIAPGTDVEYTLRIRNTDKVALDYSLVPALSYTSEHSLPIVIRLLDDNDDYVIGSATEWVALDAVGEIECGGTLLKNETKEYVFQWKWPYESGDDAYDSFLGSLDGEENVGAEISFGLHATASLDVASNGGFFSSPQGRVIVLLIIAILLAVAIALLLIYIFTRRKPPAEAPVEPAAEPTAEPVAAEPQTAKVTVPYQRQRGFYGKMAYVNIDTLAECFDSGALINIGILKEKGIIPKNAKQMKVLARSNAALDKAFIIETQGISQNARESILRAGGRVIITAPDGDKRN